MKEATKEDFNELSENGGCRLHMITLNEFDCQINVEKTMKRLPQFINALIDRLRVDNKDSKLAEILVQNPLPFDIWTYDWEIEINGKTFLTNKPKITKEKRISYYFVFHKMLNYEQTAYWNMWTLGFFTRTFK